MAFIIAILQLHLKISLLKYKSNNMIITHIKGGLGNQMFQYACGYVLAQKTNQSHVLDITQYNTDKNETKRDFELHEFNISSRIAEQEDLYRVRGKKDSLLNLVNTLNSFLLNRKYIDFPIQKYLGCEDIYLDGYFQSERFFFKYRKDLLSEFSLKEELKTIEYKKIEKKIQKDKNSVSIHIRRGDYITNQSANKYHGTLNLDYYKNGINKIKVENKNVYVFSDEIDWVKENFKFLPKSSFFISQYNLSSGQEIMLMSLCKNNIVANSSFSWWGAWLNKQEGKKVIAPRRWTLGDARVNNDIIPETWIKL